MLVPNRHGSNGSYRYGFQGQEKDDELKGEGNSVNYKFRMHDPRVGRFFAVDPLAKKYPHYTPYQFSGNKVIQYVELEGLEEGASGSLSCSGGAKAAYSLGGGFSFSLYAGLSAKGNIGSFGAMGSANLSATAYHGGPGTSELSPWLTTLTLSPALTLGYGKGNSMELNTFNSQSGSGVMNSFDSSVTYGKNYTSSSGKNSDGSGRDQTTGAVAIKLGNLQVASYNDTSSFPFYGPGTDQFWTAGLNASAKNGNLTAQYSFDCYYGLSNVKGRYHNDRIIGGINFDNQNVFDMILNNGIEKMSMQHSVFGTLQSGYNTGADSFWPSNKMHDAQPFSSYLKPDATFHHLYVPYLNRESKVSKKRMDEYSSGHIFQ
jgi:RHS repeat-associated protein